MINRAGPRGSASVSGRNTKNTEGNRPPTGGLHRRSIIYYFLSGGILAHRERVHPSTLQCAHRAGAGSVTLRSQVAGVVGVKSGVRESQGAASVSWKIRHLAIYKSNAAGLGSLWLLRLSEDKETSARWVHTASFYLGSLHPSRALGLTRNYTEGQTVYLGAWVRRVVAHD